MTAFKFQWDTKGLHYEHGQVLRGGAKTMDVFWDVDKKKLVVPVAGKEGWWFF